MTARWIRRGEMNGMPEDLDRDVFLYWRDGLFLFSVLIYLVNKLVFKAIFAGGFCHAYVNDLLCISFNLPPILWLLRRIGIRKHDRPPGGSEIMVAVVAFSLVFEVWLPMSHIRSRYIYGDPWDVACYTANGLLSGIWWRAVYRHDG
jgi:hypothetical protein